MTRPTEKQETQNADHQLTLDELAVVSGEGGRFHPTPIATIHISRSYSH
jgi:hypothetical protein